MYLYSKTGETKRALFLIIERLADVSQAITFAKQQEDADLWEDLLNYSMDKPRFIRGLLEEVGTAIDPIRLVRRIPEGLEIDGLREGLSRMIKEYEIQQSISLGVARVLRGEVVTAQRRLREGQNRGLKFESEESEESEESQDTLVGFVCGHVFKLSELGVDSQEVGTGLGAKVTHVRLLRDKIKSCPICKKELE